MITNDELAKAFKCEALKPSQLFECKDISLGVMEFKSLTVNNNSKDKSHFLAPVNVTILSEKNTPIYTNRVSHQR